MRLPALATLTIAALFAAPAAVRADDRPATTPSPLHGGRMVYVGDNVALFEVVHDAASGTVTVYAPDDAGKSLKFSSAPAIVLAAKDGPRVLALTRLPGSQNVWKVADADLKGPLIDARLRVRVGDKDVEGSLAADDAVPAVPTRRVERLDPSHGGRILMVAERPFEWTHDAAKGSLTLYALTAGEGKVALAVGDVTITLVGDFGRKELTLAAVEGTPNAWRVEDAAMKSLLLDGTLRLTLDGKAVEASLVARGEHGGRILRLGGADALFLEMQHDAKAGTVTVFLVEPKNETYADSSAAFAEAPVLEVVTATGKKSLTLGRVEGVRNAWSAKDPLLEVEALEGTIRVKIVDKTYEAKLDASRPKDAGGAPK